jgi:hypothetical protein
MPEPLPGMRYDRGDRTRPMKRRLLNFLTLVSVVALAGLVYVYAWVALEQTAGMKNEIRKMQNGRPLTPALSAGPLGTAGEGEFTRGR